MNKVLIATILLAFLCSSQAFSVESLTLFKKWRDAHKKIYHNESESLYRQLVFMDNLKKIKAHNNNSKFTYTVAPNKFTDLTQEEFAFQYLMKNEIDASIKLEEETFSLSASTVAASIDWRSKGAVSPVKNQGKCGSCWTFSSTGLMESFNFIKNNVMTNFSQQQLVDCVNADHGYTSKGCSGGWPQQALDYASKYGMLTLTQLPYTATEGTCTVKSATTGYKPKSYAKVAATTDGLKAALNFSPVAVLVDATNMSYYSSGIYNNCNASSIVLNHAVLAVGYDATGNWIVKNSWGTTWGEQGFIRIAPNDTCGILRNNYYITA